MLPAIRASVTLCRLSLAFTALALASCKFGPNYAGPPSVAPEHAASTVFHRAEDSPTGPTENRWWTSLGDAELNRLVDAALAGSPDLDAARARLRQSRAGLRQARANELPTTGAAAAYLRTKNIGSLLGGGNGGGGAANTGAPNAAASSTQSSALELYNVGFDATWEIDIFGGNARAAESAKAQAEAYEADLQDAQVTLTAEVAQAYVELRDIQQRLALSQRDADVEERMLTLTQARRAGGTASDLDVERLNNQLQSTRADLVPLTAQIAEQLDRLAILTGREPGALDNELVTAAPVPLPPSTVNVGNPADLLRQRPDIRAAERRLAQQTATIGQHTAELFPKVRLLGDVGYVSSDLSRLIEPSNFTYVVAPVLQWSPFDFGRTQAKIGAAKAARDEALANYRKAVLGALQDAETALSRYGRQRENVASLLRVQKSAERASDLTQLRVRGGTATTLDELDAERHRIQAEVGVAQAQAQLTQDFVGLQKSLGLGWM